VAIFNARTTHSSVNTAVGYSLSWQWWRVNERAHRICWVLISPGPSSCHGEAVSVTIVGAYHWSRLTEQMESTDFIIISFNRITTRRRVVRQKLAVNQWSLHWAICMKSSYETSTTNSVQHYYLLEFWYWDDFCNISIDVKFSMFSIRKLIFKCELVPLYIWLCQLAVLWSMFTWSNERCTSGYNTAHGANNTAHVVRTKLNSANACIGEPV